MMNRYELPVALMTNSLIVLLWCLLYVTCASRKPSLGLWLLPLCSIGVFIMTGRGIMLFTIVIAIRFLTAPLGTRRKGNKLFPTLFVGALFALTALFFPSVFNTHHSPMPLYYSMSADHARTYWFDWAFLASIALCCSLPGIMERLPVKMRFVFFKKLNIIAGLAIAVACLFASHNNWISIHMRLECLTHQNKWNEVLSFAETVRPRDLDVTAVYDINRALCHTGKLASHMYHYPQSIASLTLPATLEKSPISIGLRSALFYFELGEINLAQRKLYEIFETSSEHPLIIKSIAETHSVKNQIAAARLVYARLTQDLVYGNYAKSMLKDLENVPYSPSSERYGKLQSLIPENDTIRTTEDITALCQELLDHGKHNPMAFEYLMAMYLSAGDLESFTKSLERAREFGHAGLPKHWSEALALYVDLIKSDDHRLGDLAGKESMSQLARFKESFIGAGRNWDLRTLRESAADSSDARRLRRAFGTTYFYYFFFQQSGPAG
jgi:hypothetical protein